jgi:enoyl-CoA hydratase/carnithine racemase
MERMDDRTIEVADGIQTVTLAEVENRNALGAVVLNRSSDAIIAANADPAIRAVVVTND